MCLAQLNLTNLRYLLETSKIRSTLSEFETAFNSFLASKIIPLIRSTAVPQIAEVIIYALETPGKRLRPTLLLWCAGASPDPQKNLSIFYAAAAVELSHSYSIIHDDLPAMDDDAVRRGKASCHVQYSEWAAILAGDALNSLSFALLVRAVQAAKGEGSAPSLANLILSLSRGVGLEGMVSGQALDLSLERESKKDYSMEEKKSLVLAIHNKKTAALFRTCCELGALLTGAQKLAPYQAYGKKLGLLFQIKDDLLDIEGNPQRMGKAARKDIDKLSYPAVFGLEQAKAECRKLVDELQKLAQKLSTELRIKIKGQRQSKADYSRQLAELPLYIIEREA